MNSHSVLAPAGFPATVMTEVAWVLIVGAGAVFLVVMALLARVVLRRRSAEAAPPADRSRLWIVGGGVVFPLVVLAALGAYALDRMALLAPVAAADELVVSVVGRQWWWEVRYRDPASGREVALANEIHVPAGRPVVLGLGSADVIHSFWVPALAGKVDMIPGRVQQLRLRAERPGVYRGPCAEFCGDQHALMALHVVVEAPDAFERWLQAQAAPAVLPSGPLAERGRAVFAAERCAACHTIRGQFDGAEDGLDLTHVASRQALGAGTLPVDAAGFARWIAAVQHVKPGARMPSYERLDRDALAALSAYLGQLR